MPALHNAGVAECNFLSIIKYVMSPDEVERGLASGRLFADWQAVRSNGESSLTGDFVATDTTRLVSTE